MRRAEGRRDVGGWEERETHVNDGPDCPIASADAPARL